MKARLTANTLLVYKPGDRLRLIEVSLNLNCYKVFSFISYFCLLQRFSVINKLYFSHNFQDSGGIASLPKKNYSLFLNFYVGVDPYLDKTREKFLASYLFSLFFNAFKSCIQLFSLKRTRY